MQEAKPDSFIMQRLMKDLKSGQLDQITAKAYLDLNVFSYLEQSLNHLLETIERNGEFEKYVEMLADRQEKEQRELRRRAREMKRLELGDAYISSESEDSIHDSDDDDTYDDETYGDEVESQNHSPKERKLSLNRGPSPPSGLRLKPSEIQMSGEIGDGIKTENLEDDGQQIAINAEQMNVVNETFNPLRFIALHLKELNEERLRNAKK